MRPTIRQYWIDLTVGVAKRATCPRRQVGAIITDADGRIIASGYNGPPSGIPNCIDEPCGGQSGVSGHSDTCYAVHAEANAILQLRERSNEADTLYCTTKPCFNCAKLICQTQIKTVIYIDSYNDRRTEEIFGKKGVRIWQH